MKKKLEELALCPFAEACAFDYGKSDVCQEEYNYKQCTIYREYMKSDPKYLKKKFRHLIERRK